MDEDEEEEPVDQEESEDEEPNDVVESTGSDLEPNEENDDDEDDADDDDDVQIIEEVHFFLYLGNVLRVLLDIENSRGDYDAEGFGEAMPAAESSGDVAGDELEMGAMEGGEELPSGDGIVPTGPGAFIDNTPNVGSSSGARNVPESSGGAFARTAASPPDEGIDSDSGGASSTVASSAPPPPAHVIHQPGAQPALPAPDDGPAPSPGPASALLGLAQQPPLQLNPIVERPDSKVVPHHPSLI